MTDLNRRTARTREASGAPAEQDHNVVALGWVAFFGGLAQDMIQPILPLFYSSVLGLNKEFIGLIEGSLTTVVSLMKIGAGYLSDFLGKRKAIVFVGYALSAAARFSLGLAGSGTAVFGLRLTDGVGESSKDAPRDALVAELVPEESRGAAYGLYNAAIGVMALPASLIAGLLWHRISPAVPFAFGAALAGLALIGLWFVPSASAGRHGASS